jgi:hypothetical protein
VVEPPETRSIHTTSPERAADHAPSVAPPGLGGLLAALSGGSNTTQLNTPFKTPDSEDVAFVEVTDPTHPLFGRRFRVVSISTPLNSPNLVFVHYQEKVVLRIPVSATDLAPSPRTLIRTKLTSQAISEFISLAKQCEVLCQPNHPTSGDDCLPNSNNKPSHRSSRSSRR